MSRNWEKLSFRSVGREEGSWEKTRRWVWNILKQSGPGGDIWLFRSGGCLLVDSKRVRDDCAFYRGRGNVALAHGEDMINVLLMTVLAIQQPPHPRAS